MYKVVVFCFLSLLPFAFKKIKIKNVIWVVYFRKHVSIEGGEICRQLGGARPPAPPPLSVTVALASPLDWQTAEARAGVRVRSGVSKCGPLALSQTDRFGLGGCQWVPRHMHPQLKRQCPPRLVRRLRALWPTPGVSYGITRFFYGTTVYASPNPSWP